MKIVELKYYKSKAMIIDNYFLKLTAIKQKSLKIKIQLHSLKLNYKDLEIKY
jgi:hypothetical protein